MKHFPLITTLLLTSLCISSAGARSFEHLDVSFTLGSTGIGVDVATPLCNWLDFRGGFSFIPNIHVSGTISMTDSTLSEGDVQSKFDKISGTFEELTGYKLNKEIDMEGYTHFYHGNVMLDFRPFSNKHWHITAGVYFGPSDIVTTKNTPESMSTLLSIGTYNYYANRLNDPQVTSGEVPFFSCKDLALYVYSDELTGDEFYLQYGDDGVFIENPTVKSKFSNIINNLRKYGNISATVGVKNNGEPYRMVPNEQGIITATVKVNPVKPYLGFGYEGSLSKKSEKYLIGFDCGVMFWGGVPHFYMHDGTDLTYELSDYNSMVGSYCQLLKSLPVYPVANVRLIRRIDFNRH